ncbi:ADP-heptose:LPS heptosyltransferase [Nicoletella semolina]|uniref:ADP-heptose:LPS heptosyltransferase n=1 Tax=Nicoletella semolina TaxID=271160 RepID=A0A4R2N7C2_9PAST|nr:glycosyltransferase family 9 protein [Nicoletella semolina]MDH2924380.1 heptosyltransferase [Nicoletella semolina]TCP16840.1 ADP-heptose:LPS heptosyltransferase [Nicoletella semolina]
MSIKAILRNIRIIMGKFFIDKWSISQPIQQPIRKILFMRQDGKIGDYIVSSFVFREIKKHSPDTHIGVICSYNNAYMFEKNPHIDQLYLVKTKSIIDYIRCGRSLAKEEYDVVLDPTIQLRNRDLLLLRLICAIYYVGVRKQNYQLFNFNITNSQQHFSLIYKDMLALLDIKPISLEYDIPCAKQEKEEVKQFLAEKNLTDYISINFFGAGNTRRLDKDKMQELLNTLTKSTKRPIVLLAIPSEIEILKALSKQYNHIFVYEKTKNIFHTIELIRHASLLISPDTSTVHIAAGLQKKIICFYSADEDNFTHWHPNNKNKTVILRFNKNINEIDFTTLDPKWLN